VPPELDAFFAKALALEKEDRYQNAQEFIDALLDAVEDLSADELDAHPTGGVPGAERGTGGRSRASSGSLAGRAPAPGKTCSSSSGCGDPAAYGKAPLLGEWSKAPGTLRCFGAFSFGRCNPTGRAADCPRTRRDPSSRTDRWAGSRSCGSRRRRSADR
jgi:hypothetical protein